MTTKFWQFKWKNHATGNEFTGGVFEGTAKEAHEKADEYNREAAKAYHWFEPLEEDHLAVQELKARKEANKRNYAAY
jgi:hypothetical protein